MASKLRSTFTAPSCSSVFSNRRRSTLVGIAVIWILLALSILLYTHPTDLSKHWQRVSDVVAPSRALYDDSPLSLSDSTAMDRSVYNFTASRPKWLAPLPRQRPEPLIIRLAIISHPREFERRKAFRQYVLSDLPSHEIKIQYRFIMGYTDTADDRRVSQERALHNDVLVLDMKESMDRMGEKRWRMLKWGAEVPGSTYDFYMSADTDAFLRLAALARRLRGYKSQPPLPGNPRETDILWGHMGVHALHLVPSLDESHPELEDEQVDGGEWYSYPYGFGYLYSSHLVDRMTQQDVVLPHHIHYPADDVILGMWVADYAKGATVVNDVEGFHDPTGHHSDETTTRPVSWDTVVAHHLQIGEMRGLRYVEEFADEWDRPPAP